MRIQTMIGVFAAPFLLTQPAQATGLLSSLWPATDAELQAVNWSGFFASPRLNYARFDVTGDGAAGFNELEGPLVGGRIGYDWQVGRFVLGLASEGQIGFAEEDGSGPADGSELSLDTFGTITGRVGVTSGRFLFFATGGAAFSQIEISNAFEDDETLSGWTAGGGVEYAWNAATFVRLEYNRVELDEGDFSNLPGTADSIGLESDMFGIGFIRKFH